MRNLKSAVFPPEDKEKNAEATAVANSQLSLSEGSTSNQALTYGNVAATAIAKWLGAGYNFVGGRTMIKRGNYWVEDKWAVSKDYEKGDNWKVINQKDIFGDNEAFIDGRDSYIEPLTGIGVDEADSRMILKAWNLAAYKEFLGSESNAHLGEAVAHLEDLDLSVDYFGNEREKRHGQAAMTLRQEPAAVCGTLFLKVDSCLKLSRLEMVFQGERFQQVRRGLRYIRQTRYCRRRYNRSQRSRSGHICGESRFPSAV